MKDRKVKQVLPGGWYQWEGGEYKERLKKGEYGGNTMYLMSEDGKTRPIESILKGGEGIQENDGGGEFN
jgi:hypothetical protein